MSVVLSDAAGGLVASVGSLVVRALPREELGQAAVVRVALFGVQWVPARACSAAGDAARRRRCHDLAVETYRMALQAGYRDLGKLRKSPELNALRGHPDFPALLREIDRAGGM